jgi:hypothetical protein
MSYPVAADKAPEEKRNRLGAMQSAQSGSTSTRRRMRHRSRSGPFRGRNTVHIAGDHIQEDYLCHFHSLSRLETREG